MNTEINYYEQMLIAHSIRTRIMWIENNFINDTFSDLAESYRIELADLKKLLLKYE